MPGVRTYLLPSDGADPSALLASLFSTAAGMPPTLVDGDGEILAFVIADPSDSVERAYDARPIPAGTTAKLALGNPLTGVLYAETDTFLQLPLAGYSVKQVQAGTSSLPAIVEISLSPAPYGGTFTVDGVALDWGVSEDVFAAQFPGFSIQKTGTFAWRMTGAANGAYSPVVSVAGLLVLTGLQFALDLGAATALAYAFGEESSEQISAQLTLRVAFPGTALATYFLSPVTVALSVLSFAVGADSESSIVTQTISIAAANPVINPNVQRVVLTA